MMYQQTNTNFFNQDINTWFPGSHIKGYLPTIQEDKQLFSGEINLECNEVIEDWDDLESYSMYSPTENETSLPGKHHRCSPTEALGLSMYDGSPPPNSPVPFMIDSEPDLSVYSDHINGVLKTFKEETDGPENFTEHTQVQLNLNSNVFDQSEANDMEVPVDDEQSVTLVGLTSPQEDQSNQDVLGDLSESQVPDNVRLVDATTNTSPRASSPESLGGPSGISFQNFRSVSPPLLRSPSPISNGSSSPRFLRSPSPLEIIEQGMAGLPFDENSSFSLYSNSSFSGSDHEVPDVDNQFREVVEDMPEFPSYRSYMRQRIMDSCQDHLVPDVIEE